MRVKDNRVTKLSLVAEANYQNQNSILVVDTNLRIIQNTISIV